MAAFAGLCRITQWPCTAHFATRTQADVVLTHIYTHANTHTHAHTHTHTRKHTHKHTQSKEEIERNFFQKAMAMCQDVDNTVRLSMCEQLAAIGRACGKDVSLSNLLSELFELLKDEEIKVG